MAPQKGVLLLGQLKDKILWKLALVAFYSAVDGFSIPDRLILGVEN